MRLLIIGQGNVALNLQHGLALQGLQVPTHSSREGLDSLPEAECYIYAVRDEALAEVVAQVNAPQALHLHTSGTMPISVFGDDKPHAGILYFLQTFSRDVLIDDWSSIPAFIQGKSIDDVAAIYTLALMLTKHIYETTQHDRERLHVAGVFANNFSNYMFTVASDLLRGTSIPFKALQPLIDQTAQKIHTISPRAAQTGPAIRGDQEVMRHHEELLPSDDLKQLYQLISKLIQQR